MNSISKTIKHLRETINGLTKITLADLANTSRTVIFKIEAGTYNPGLDVLERICVPLGAVVSIRAKDGIEVKYIMALRAYRSTHAKRDQEVVEIFEKILQDDLFMTAEEVTQLTINSL